MDIIIWLSGGMLTALTLAIIFTYEPPNNEDTQ